MLSSEDAGYLQKHFADARVLNHWNIGGYLIFATHGTVRPFVDGRAATAYPDDLLHDYFKLVSWEIDEAAWDMVLDKYRIDAVLWVRHTNRCGSSWWSGEAGASNTPALT